MGCLENFKGFLKSKTTGAKSRPGQKVEPSGGTTHPSQAEGKASTQPPSQPSQSLDQQHRLENLTTSIHPSNRPNNALHSTPSTNSAPKAVTVSPEPSNAAQETPRPNATPPADSVNDSIPPPPNEELAEGSQLQDKQTGPPMVKTLWEKAAADLDSKGLKKLKSVFESRRSDQTAVAGVNETTNCGNDTLSRATKLNKEDQAAVTAVSPTPDDVRKIISGAKALKEADSNATWRPVSSFWFKTLAPAQCRF